MIVMTIVIDEHRGISAVARPVDASPFEIDIARKIAEQVKATAPPPHGKIRDVITEDNFPTFENS